MRNLWNDILPIPAYPSRRYGEKTTWGYCGYCGFCLAGLPSPMHAPCWHTGVKTYCEQCGKKLDTCQCFPLQIEGEILS